MTGDGKIDFNEFITSFENTITPPSNNELVEAFKAMDKNGDGFMNADEFKEV